MNDLFPTQVSKQEVASVVSRMAVDTAPGPDHVLMRIVKDDMVMEIISLITTLMLKSGHVPSIFKQARTVIIYKKGDINNIKNWRPISICSVVRRVVERILDKRLRQYVSFNINQRGFTNSPGNLINTSLLKSVLAEAKTKRGDATVVFLDISKAFDNIGHLHLATP